MSAHDQIQELQSRMGESIIGQKDVVERLLIGLLANGNLLVEGLPGLAKTRAIKALAKNVEAQFSRIQFTPDLLPSDVTGTEVYYQKDGAGEFRFEPGPIFANIVLGDEINRAPAKVQSALLEAMEERQITVGKNTYPLPGLYFVMATQNPIEQEGTYPLPESQLDRFLLKITVDYPAVDNEVEIMRQVRSEALQGQMIMPNNNLPISQESIFAGRAQILQMFIAEPVEQYIVQLVDASRHPAPYSAQLAEWIQYGASPRASLAFDRCARALAWLEGRDYVSPEDVQQLAHEVLRHRILLTYQAEADGVSIDAVIDELLAKVPVT
jgi:MoxR-like ATPase